MNYAILDTEGNMLARYPGPDFPDRDQIVACLEKALFFPEGHLLQLYPDLHVMIAPLH